MDGLFVGRDLDALNAFQFLDAALHLLGIGGLITEAVNKGLELRDALAVMAVCGLELCLAFGFLSEKLLVIVRIEGDALVPYFGRVGDSDIEKITIMRDDDVS